MTKVAIKNENITSFGGIYPIMDIFSKFGFEKLTNLYWVNVEVVVKHSVMEVLYCLYSSQLNNIKTSNIFLLHI